MDLWDKAVGRLDSDIQVRLKGVQKPMRDILGAVLDTAEKKRDQALRKGWRFKKPGGEIILVRDVLEKIVDWVQRFKATGDTIVQYDPAHAALPWAAFRFLLQVAVSEVEFFGALVDDLEYIARMMVRYHNFEEVYLRRSQPELEQTLGECLVRLYAEVLTHLDQAIKFFGESPLKRVLKSPFRSLDQERAKAMRAREDEVEAFARLVDSEALRACEKAITRLSLKTTRELSEEKHNDISEWLSVARYQDHHKLITKDRLPNAGRWLLGHSEYLSWQNSSCCSILLVHGIPGAGKSTLSSVVIDSMLELAAATPDLAPFGYFYCANIESEIGRRSSDHIMRTILLQLAIDTTQKNKLREFLCDEYDRQVLMARAGKWDLPRLTTNDCVRLILELGQQDPMTIILDGLDSVDDNERHVLICAFRDIVSKADNVIKIFVTSRTSGRADAVPDAQFQIHITSQETRSDMEAFVDHQIDGAMASKRLLSGSLSSGARAKIRHELISGAGEMFLWAKLKLERMFNESDENDVLTILRDDLPKDINHLYQEFFNRIFSLGPSARNIATKIFSWILFMREPLHHEALLTALASGEQVSWTMSQVMATCSAFIVLDHTSDVLRFIHQSAQDFLMQQPKFAATEAHRVLASSCLEVCRRGSSLKANVTIPFRLPIDNFDIYAALHWPGHAEMSHEINLDDQSLTTTAKDVSHAVQTFIFDEDWDITWPFEHWIRCGKSLASGLPRDHAMVPFLEAIPDTDSGFLFLLSMLGLNDILASALSSIEGLDVNERNKAGHTPIYLAANFGHSETINLLVSHGADVNVECGSYGSPLHVACYRGHLAAVRQLQRSGAQRSCGSVFKHSLQAAVHGGQEDIALHVASELTSIEDEDYEEMLYQASFKGFRRVVDHLQSMRPSESTSRESKRTRQRIRKAIQEGNENSLCSLLEFYGLDANTPDSFPADAVALATLHNCKQMVEFLIERGLSLEVEGYLGSPLRIASLLNFQSLVRLLLAKGAQASAIGKFGDALQAAASNGHTTILRLLLQEGVNVNQSSGYFGQPIQAAAYYGHTDTVELLLDADASTDQAGLFQNALEAAAKGGNHDVIELILRKRRKVGFEYVTTGRANYALDGCKRAHVLLHALSPENRRSNPSEHPLQSEAGALLHDRKMPVVDKMSIHCDMIAENEVAEFSVSIEQHSNDGGSWERSLLVIAASSGHVETVKWLLMARQESPTLIAQAISSAAEHGHISVLEGIISCIAEGQCSTGRFGDEAPLDVDSALEIVWEHCQGDDYTTLSDMFCGIASKYSLQAVPKDELLQDFAAICKTGDIKAATAVIGSCHHEMLSPSVVDGGLQLCAFHKRLELATFILTCPALQQQLPLSGEEIFVTAAANGALEIMKISAQRWEPLRRCRLAMGRALNMASEYGHFSVVEWLVLQHSAGVSALSPDVGFGAMLKNAGYSVRRTRQHPFIEQPADSTARYLEGLSPYSQDGTTHISPLQAALRGFADRFGPQKKYVSESTMIRQRAASHHDQERVISFLLDKGANPNDLGGQTIAPIHKAAMSCSPLTVGLMISAGADVNAASREPPSVLDFPGLFIPISLSGLNMSYRAIHLASRREREGFSVLQRLVAADAKFPEDAREQEYLVSCSLGYFDKTIYNEQPATVEDIFSDGVGASLLFLLSRLFWVRTRDPRWTPILQIAVCLNDANFVELLLSRGTDVNCSGSYYGTALQAAAHHGHLAMVQRLLDRGAQVNQIAGGLCTALRAAVRGGFKEVVQLLFSHGADLKIAYGGSGPGSDNTLQLAVQTLSLDLVKEVVAQGVDVTSEIGKGTQQPLIFAANEGSIGIASFLLGAGAPVNVCGQPKHSHLDISAPEASPIHAASFNGNLAMLDLLLQFGADIELEIADLGTPLAVAASAGRIEVMQRLLEVGAKVNSSAILTGAIRSRETEAVKLLISSGAEANNGEMSLACHLHRLDIVELLLNQAHDEKALSALLDQAYSTKGLSSQATRLLLARSSPTMSQFLQTCGTGSAACVKLLLQEELIEVNGLASESASYPLQVAAMHLQPEVVDVLVRHGADIDCKTSDHGTPLILALEACAAPILQSMGGEVIPHILKKMSLPSPKTFSSREWPRRIHNEVDSHCKTIVENLVTRKPDILKAQSILGPPLHLACLIGNKSLVELLLKQGEDPFTTAGHFKNALFAAIPGENPAIISLLLQSSRPEYLNLRHPQYGTVLHLACALGDEETAGLLLQHGSDATVRDAQNRTPLAIAIEQRLMRHKSHGDSPNNLLGVLLDQAKVLLVELEDLLAAADLEEPDYGSWDNALFKLLCHDNRTFATGHQTVVEGLQLVLKHRPATCIPPDLVLHVLEQGKSSASAFLTLMQTLKKRVDFTYDIHCTIDRVYDLESDKAVRDHFHALDSQDDGDLTHHLHARYYQDDSDYEGSWTSSEASID